MTDKKNPLNCDAKFLFNIAGVLAKKQKENQPINEENKNLDAEQEEFLAVLTDPENVNTLDNEEIKKLYKELKVKYYADKDHKKYFKKVKKNVKAMIKSDKKRTKLRFIRKAGKYTAILGLIAAVWYDVKKYGYIPQLPRAVGDIYLAIRVNANIIHEYMPLVERCLIACGLGIAVYAGAKTAIKVQDLRTLRRMTCKVLAEELDLNDVIRLKKTVKEIGINDVEEFYPLAELCDSKKQKQSRLEAVKNNDEMTK